MSEHYRHSGIECIDAIEAATEHLTGVEAFNVGNVIKYLWRYKFKNGKADLLKALDYLNKTIELNNEPTN